MSADNYYFVRKLENGKYDVTHRFASCYYLDEMGDGQIRQDAWFEGTSEGWSVRGSETKYATLEEAEAAVPFVPDEWIEEVSPHFMQFPTLEQAVMYAHKLVAEGPVVEYGVIIQKGLI